MGTRDYCADWLLAVISGEVRRRILMRFLSDAQRARAVESFLARAVIRANAAAKFVPPRCSEPIRLSVTEASKSHILLLGYIIGCF